MTPLSPNARLVAYIFEEVARGNGAPFREACRDGQRYDNDDACVLPDLKAPGAAAQ